MFKLLDISCKMQLSELFVQKLKLIKFNLSNQIHNGIAQKIQCLGNQYQGTQCFKIGQ